MNPASPPRRPFAELLDAKAVARRLKVPTSWVFAQARARRIPHHRLGHYVRFDPDDIERWLRADKVTIDTPTNERTEVTHAGRAGVM